MRSREPDGTRGRGRESRAREPDDARATEAHLLVAVLTAAAVASLTWFPFQRPVTAVPLLLAAGRAWRLLAPIASGAPSASGAAASRPAA